MASTTCTHTICTAAHTSRTRTWILKGHTRGHALIGLSGLSLCIIRTHAGYYCNIKFNRIYTEVDPSDLKSLSIYFKKHIILYAQYTSFIDTMHYTFKVPLCISSYLTHVYKLHLHLCKILHHTHSNQVFCTHLDNHCNHLPLELTYRNLCTEL